MTMKRREFIATSTGALVGSGVLAGMVSRPGSVKDAIIDIHQHADYHGRNAEDLLVHQRAMGVTKTILLPAGRPVNAPSTHNGMANGLQAKATGNEVCYGLATDHPREFYFAANEVPDLPDATTEVEKYLKLGAKLIGESKFGVACDSPEMQRLYQLAQEYDVPILLHWQHEMYNYGFERFYKMLEKYPRVNFLGHAQTWWANIGKEHTDQKVLYPKSHVTPGGLTDRYLKDYSNIYGDLSAASGLNALLRDEEHARAFLDRHQDKLLYGSDCADNAGAGDGCDGSKIIAAIRRLAPDRKAERKILWRNANRLFRF